MKKSTKYDYLIVGAGLFGSTFAHLATQAGKKCLVIDRRSHVGGNCYSRKMAGIDVHLYGPHIFHTSNMETWKFVDSLSPMRPFFNQPLANFRDELYNLPFNMNTFRQIFGVSTPEDARMCIEQDRIPCERPSNLEEYCLATVGRTIYERLVKSYTEKQWGKKCTELPASLIKRLPLRMSFDNTYFSDLYQGVPENGYDHLFDQLLSGGDIITDCDYFSNKTELDRVSEKVLYTGRLDTLFDYKFGVLEYRGLAFAHDFHACSNYQGNAVINFTDDSCDYTRQTEHSHFNPPREQNVTIVTSEYPIEGIFLLGNECYPIPTQENLELAEKYKDLAHKENIIFGGRLADYQYCDMDTTIEKAMALWKKESSL